PFNSVLRLNPHVYPVFYLAFCLAVLIAVYLFLERLFWSPFGRALRSLREDGTAAAAFGRNVFALKLKGYVIGGVIAGLGGALFVHFLGAFNVSAWSPVETLLLYAAIFVGGTGNNRGVILGIFLVLIFFQEVTRFLPEIPGDLLEEDQHQEDADRKSTRLNSSHVKISYAVFCLKKKKSTPKIS